MKLTARGLGVLPSGTLPVGAGLVVLGIGSYAQLALAGHGLSTTGMAAMSVLWSIVFWLGLGLFFPVEQELIRLVAARRDSVRASARSCAGPPCWPVPSSRPRSSRWRPRPGRWPTGCSAAIWDGGRAGDRVRGAGGRLGEPRRARRDGKVQRLRHPARASTAACASFSPSRSAAAGQPLAAAVRADPDRRPVAVSGPHARPGSRGPAPGAAHHLAAAVPGAGPAHRLDICSPSWS